MRRFRTKKMEKTMPEGLGFRVWGLGLGINDMEKTMPEGRKLG